jgi:hypothetical protein
MKKILFMGLPLGVLATMAVATTGTMSAAYAVPDEEF